MEGLGDSYTRGNNTNEMEMEKLKLFSQSRSVTRDILLRGENTWIFLTYQNERDGEIRKEEGSRKSQ